MEETCTNATAVDLCQLACDVALDMCDANIFIPPFVCELAYDACMGLCTLSTGDRDCWMQGNISERDLLRNLMPLVLVQHFKDNPSENVCYLGPTPFKSGYIHVNRCMILQCQDGSWIYTSIIKTDCGNCKLTGDPHISTYELNSNNVDSSGNNGWYTYKYEGVYAATQPGLTYSPSFGVYGNFENCDDSAYVSCVKGFTYFEPGMIIIVTDNLKWPLEVLLNASPITVSDTVQVFGKSGQVYVFTETSLHCIYIVGSTGLSVRFCLGQLPNYYYNKLDIWAMDHLQAAPTTPQTSGQLYGLCDQYTVSGQELSYYTMRNGAHSVNSTLFAETWQVI